MLAGWHVQIGNIACAASQLPHLGFQIRSHFAAMLRNSDTPKARVQLIAEE
jgi:hypothetical protein